MKKILGLSLVLLMLSVTASAQTGLRKHRSGRNCTRQITVGERTELRKDALHLGEGDGRGLKLHVNNVVVAIDLVVEAGNGFELMVEFQNLFEIADSGCVDLKFDHKGVVDGVNPIFRRRFSKLAKPISLTMYLPCRDIRAESILWSLRPC